ncbi:MAG: hypothetical protein AAF269_10265 [Pseudomonadota bacterium]
MTISPNTLLLIGAWAALSGGALRVTTAFIPFTPETLWLEALYALIDVLMLVATLALYIRHMAAIGLIGLFAAAGAMLGFASIIGPDPVMFGIDFYQLGAGMIVISMALLGVQLLRAKQHRLAAALWLLALVFAIGLSALSIPGLLLASGVAFGTGFMVAGARLLRDGADVR